MGKRTKSSSGIAVDTNEKTIQNSDSEKDTYQDFLSKQHASSADFSYELFVGGNGDGRTNNEDDDANLDVGSPVQRSDNSFKSQPSPVAGHAMPCWLSTPGPSEAEQDQAWLPKGFNPDASLSTFEFDTPSTIAAFDDDGSQVRMGGGEDGQDYENDDVTTQSAEARLTEDLAKRGMNTSFTVDEDCKSLSEMSELSIGNASYILDLAQQKENRDKQMNSVALEEALELYKSAEEDGHKGEQFFLMILSEVRTKVKTTSKKFYRLQDKRLDEALEDELKRRETAEELPEVAHHSPKGRTSERVSAFIERENKRNSVIVSPFQANIATVAAEVSEFQSKVDYDWGGTDDDDRSDDTDDIAEFTKQRMKKKKAKKKKKETSERSERSGARKLKKKSKSKLLLETSAKDSRSRPSESDTNPKRSKSKNPKKPKRSSSKTRSKSVERGVGLEADPETPKRKKSTITSKRDEKASKGKLSKAKSKKKVVEPSSTLSTAETSQENDSLKEETNNKLDEPQPEIEGSRVQVESTTSRNDKHRGEEPMDPRDEMMASAPTGIIEQNTYSPRRPSKRSTQTKSLSSKKRMSGLVSSLFRPKQKATPDLASPTKSGFFRRRKSMNQDMNDPGNRLLPIPGSQLQ